MQIRTNCNLPNLKGKSFYFRPWALKRDRKELYRFLEGEEYFRSESFVHRALFGEEIRANNQIEGYNDDIEVIKRAIENASSIKNSEQKTRILNLYNAYRYILEGHTINKESMNALYKIASDGVLDEFSLTHMDEFYRTREVFIVNSKDGLDSSKGMPVEKLDEFLEAYFNFLNTEIAGDETEEYIKSQILHFYFVYIHPYFDVNGRTSRTIAMWYLLNKKAYPYIIFNRGISFKGSSYADAISRSIKTRDMTYFLKLMLETLQLELEKEYVIHRAHFYAKGELDIKDVETLHLFLSYYGRKTLFDFAFLYNSKNDYKTVKDIYENMITPLLDKGILDVLYEMPHPKGEIGDKVLTMRPLNLDASKVKHLQL